MTTTVLTATHHVAVSGAGLAAVPGLAKDPVADAVAEVRAALARLESAIATTQSQLPPAVAGLQAVERVSALVEARRYRLIVAAAGDEPEYLSQRTASGRDTRVSDIRAVELGAYLGCSADRARTLAYRARIMCHELPELLDLLDRGEIGGYHTLLATDGWRDLVRRWDAADSPMPLDTAARFQSRILFRVTTRTVSDFRRRIAATVALLAPLGVQAAQQAARDQREVTVTDAGDGMAWLTAYLEATAAQGVLQVLEHAARHDTTLTGTQAQRTADALVAIVTGATELSPASRSAAAEVHLLVSADALAAGRLVGQIAGTDFMIEGGVLQGLLADARFRRLLVDCDGRLLDFGRTTYRPPTALADHVVARDRTCRAPGCGRPARYTDLDHITPWDEGGETSARNLAALCRTHHVLKTHGGWSYSVDDTGTAHWRLPGGSTIARAPADYSEYSPPF